MKRSVKVIVLSAIIVVGVPTSWAGTMSGQVVDYNAAKVRLANGVLVVPAGMAVYTATSTIPMGSSFIVTLPSGFRFATAPALTSSGAATFTPAGGGIGSNSATFTVATSDVSPADTITLGTYTVNGATALQTITPIASALPLTMQAIGVDALPLPFKEFASDSGVMAVFVGAIQFIDLQPPSNGSKFGNGIGDTLTAVLSAIAISAETVDFATQTVPILGADGLLNTLAPGDTATVVLPGTYGNLASVFVSTTANCANPISTGTVSSGALTIPNVPINHEEFICVTGNGSALELLGAGPGGGEEVGPNTTGFANVSLNPGSATDYLTSTNVNIEYPGDFCYTNNGRSCVVAPTIGMTFSPATTTVGGTTTLSFTINDPASNPAGLTAIGFTDSLPPGLAVATPNGLTNSCGGTVTAVAGSGTISLSGGSVALGSSCVFTVSITATAPGNLSNSVNNGSYAYVASGDPNFPPAFANIQVLPAAVGIPVMSLPALAGFALLLAGLASFLARRAATLP